MVSVGVASFSVNQNSPTQNTLLLESKRYCSLNPQSLVKVSTSARLRQHRTLRTRSSVQLPNYEQNISAPARLQLKTGTGLNRSLDVEFNVRDYELDQYGVVNNSVYSHYIQQANGEYLTMLGYTVNEVAQRGHALAVRELSLKFIAPLRSGDKFLVKVSMHSSSMARLQFQHHMLKLPNMEPILEARGSLVWLDENYRPVRVPSELIANVGKFNAISSS